MARAPTARVGDPLYEKDTIETGADGAIGITFIDNTVMSGGPDSQIVLEDYKFNSSNFKGSMLTDMNRGTVSMISGDIAGAQHARRDEGQDAHRDSRRARHPLRDRSQRQPLIMRRIALALALLLIASCSSRQSLFVVLPNPDGSSGAVTIEDGQKSVVLDQPYAAGEVRGGRSPRR